MSTAQQRGRHMQNQPHPQVDAAHAAPLKTWTSADGVKVIPIELEKRPHVDTATAAAYLLRRPQTLRAWAMRENGPIRPVRIGVRLAWPVAEIRKLLGEVAQ